jgi:hypothetical protein
MKGCSHRPYALCTCDSSGGTIGEAEKMGLRTSPRALPVGTVGSYALLRKLEQRECGPRRRTAAGSSAHPPDWRYAGVAAGADHGRRGRAGAESGCSALVAIEASANRRFRNMSKRRKRRGHCT